MLPALLAAGLAVGSCSTGDGAASTTANPPSSSNPAERSTTSPAPAQLVQIDLETNVTVFFDPVSVTSPDQGRDVLTAIIGARIVDSVTVVDRMAAWEAAIDLASRLPTPIDLDTAWEAAVGEVARLVVTDEEVRNGLTDDIEDSTAVLGIAYIVGVRPGLATGELTPWTVWELLGYFWVPN